MTSPTVPHSDQRAVPKALRAGAGRFTSVGHLARRTLDVVVIVFVAGVLLSTGRQLREWYLEPAATLPGGATLDQGVIDWPLDELAPVDGVSFGDRWLSIQTIEIPLSAEMLPGAAGQGPPKAGIEAHTPAESAVLNRLTTVVSRWPVPATRATGNDSSTPAIQHVALTRLAGRLRAHTPDRVLANDWQLHWIAGPLPLVIVSSPAVDDQPATVAAWGWVMPRHESEPDVPVSLQLQLILADGGPDVAPYDAGLPACCTRTMALRDADGLAMITFHASLPLAELLSQFHEQAQRESRAGTCEVRQSDTQAVMTYSRARDHIRIQFIRGHATETDQPDIWRGLMVVSPATGDHR